MTKAIKDTDVYHQCQALRSSAGYVVKSTDLQKTWNICTRQHNAHFPEAKDINHCPWCSTSLLKIPMTLAKGGMLKPLDPPHIKEIIEARKLIDAQPVPTDDRMYYCSVCDTTPQSGMPCKCLSMDVSTEKHVCLDCNKDFKYPTALTLHQENECDRKVTNK